MDAAMAASSPKPADQRRVAVYTSEELLQFMNAGVFTRDEVREMVREAMRQPPQPNVQDTIVTYTTPKPNTPLPKPKRKIAKKLKLVPAASPSVGKSRKRKSTNDPESDLRDVTKNTTRRRFFSECCNLNSKLWVDSEKNDKQYMHRLLFDRATVDVLNVLHREQPGKLRSLTDDQITKCIRWQVARDRNNWAGKTPIRVPFTGEPMKFNFEAAFLEIEQALANAQDLTEEEPSIIPSREEVARRLVKSELAALKIDGPSNSKEHIQMCINCRINVWTGAAESCPKVMQLANPFETDWANSPNAQPYCAKCWGEEEKLMGKMGQEHCAVGPKRKKLDEAVAAAQTNAVAAAIANAKTPPEPITKNKGAKKKTENKGAKNKGAKNKGTKNKGTKNKGTKNKGRRRKKKLGGVRTSDPVPKPKPKPWWQVCA